MQSRRTHEKKTFDPAPPQEDFLNPSRGGGEKKGLYQVKKNKNRNEQ